MMDVSGLSLPEEFLLRMKRILKDEYPEFLSSYEKESFRSLRVNHLKGSRGPDIHELKKEFSLTEVPWCEGGFYYDPESSPGKHVYHEAGLYYIQEASAMAPVKWLDIKSGMRVLDLAAAPGGKSTEIAEELKDTGLLIANEPVRERAKILSLNIERLGIGNALVTNELPEKLSDIFTGFFDRILLDAPCSGEGMFRKNPEAISEWSLENVRHCRERQLYIIKEAAKMLSPGGIMVYSTCTFSEEENEGLIADFLAEDDDLSLIDPDSIRKLPEGFIRSEIKLTDGRQGYGVRIFPHKVKGEGHFFAVLKRQGTENPGALRIAGSGTLREAEKGVRDLFKRFSEESLKGSGSKDRIVHSFGNELYLSDPAMPGIKGLKVMRPGLHLGTIKKDRFEPAHALALYLSPEEAEINAELTDIEEAVRFLRGETLDPRIIDSKKGWCIVSFRGLSLGWGKSDGRMIKNHYPKGLRIRQTNG